MVSQPGKPEKAWCLLRREKRTWGLLCAADIVITPHFSLLRGASSHPLMENELRELGHLGANG